MAGKLLSPEVPSFNLVFREKNYCDDVTAFLPLMTRAAKPNSHLDFANENQLRFELWHATYSSSKWEKFVK